MQLRLIHLTTFLLAAACGDDGGKTTSDTEGATQSGATDSASTATDASVTGASATDSGASESASGSTTGDTPTGDATTDTGATSTGGEPGTTADTSASGAESSTGGAQGFERFVLTRAAGPCPPNTDCDGFTELLGSGLLRVERFGELGDPVTEIEVSDEDFALAVPVFTDPELTMLLDEAEPLCNAPSDVFETMLVEADGMSHDAETVFCDQAPLEAAREMADMLAMKYAP